MFTGLIKHQGFLKSREVSRLRIICPLLVPELAPGDSVAVDGACLTVEQVQKDGFSAMLLPETSNSTTLSILPLKASVNLEPALKAGDRLGGHYVQGHVTGVVQLRHRATAGSDTLQMEFELPEWLRPFAMVHGSIAVNGVSLTIQVVNLQSFSVAIIDETSKRTNLSLVPAGGKVNIEADMIIMAVQHTLRILGQVSYNITLERLRELGFME